MHRTSCAAALLVLVACSADQPTAVSGIPPNAQIKWACEAPTPLFASTLDGPSSVTAPAYGSGQGASIASAPANDFVSARLGSGYRANALSERILVPQIDNGVQNIEMDRGTMEFWYRPAYNHDDGVQYTIAGFGTVWRQPGLFLGKHNSSNSNRLWLILYNANLVRYEANVLPTQYGWRAGEWVLIRITWDFTVPAGVQNLHLYLNGAELPLGFQIARGPQPMPGESSTQYISIGARDAVGTFGPNGIYDEFRVYDYVLP